MAPRIDSSPDALIKNWRALKPNTATGRTGLTRRVRFALDLMVFGDDSGKRFSKAEAAEAARLTPRALRAALNKPSVLAYYRSQVSALREGEAAQNIATIIEIRDSMTLKASPAGQRVRLQAASALMGEGGGGDGGGVRVAINVITPGYVIDLTEPAPTIEHDARPMIPLEVGG